MKQKKKTLLVWTWRSRQCFLALNAVSACESCMHFPPTNLFASPAPPAPPYKKKSLVVVVVVAVGGGVGQGHFWPSLFYAHLARNFTCGGGSFLPSFLFLCGEREAGRPLPLLLCRKKKEERNLVGNMCIFASLVLSLPRLHLQPPPLP